MKGITIDDGWKKVEIKVCELFDKHVGGRNLNKMSTLEVRDSLIAICQNQELVKIHPSILTSL